MSSLLNVLNKLRYVKSGEIVLCDDFNNKLDFIDCSLNYLLNNLPESVNVCKYDEPDYEMFKTVYDITIEYSFGVYDYIYVIPVSCFNKNLLFFILLYSVSTFPKYTSSIYYLKIFNNYTYSLKKFEYGLNIYINYFKKSSTLPSNKYSLNVQEIIDNNVLYADVTIYKRGSKIFNNTYKVFDFNNKNIHTFFVDWYFLCRDPLACLIYIFIEENGMATIRVIAIGGSI